MKKKKAEFKYYSLVIAAATMQTSPLTTITHKYGENNISTQFQLKHKTCYSKTLRRKQRRSALTLTMC